VSETTTYCGHDECRAHIHHEDSMEGRWAPEMSGWVLAREDGEPLRPLKAGEMAQLVYLCPEHGSFADSYGEILKRGSDV
jgi:hypothetical protein